MFGVSPSIAAINAEKTFKREGISNILELGSGQGRDTLFFAKNGFHVQALDYSRAGIESINKKANLLGLSQRITARNYDVRKKSSFQ